MICINQLGMHISRLLFLNLKMAQAIYKLLLINIQMRLTSLLFSTINCLAKRAAFPQNNHQRNSHLFKMYGFATIKGNSTSIIKAPKVDNLKYYEEQQEFTETVKNYNRILSEYPFLKTSLKALRFQDVQGQLSQNAKALICWKCLQIKDQDWLSKAQEILFPQNGHLKFTEPKSKLNGHAIFQAYFQKRVNSLILKINEPSSTPQQILTNLNTLIYMQPSTIVKEEIKNIKRNIIQKANGQIILAMLTHIRIRNQLQYEDYLQKTADLLQKKQLSRSVKVRMVYILASVPYFYRHYPREIVKLLFKVLKSNLPVMSNQMIFRCLKAVYQNNSKYAIYFVQAIMKFVTELNLQKQGDRVGYLMEIILKTVSYSYVLQHSCEDLIIHLIQNTHQYNRLLQNYKYTRQTFINLVLLEGRNQHHEFSTQFKSKLNKYVERCLHDLSKREIIEFDSLFTFLKLAKKYRTLLKEQLNKAIRQKITEIVTRSQNHPDLIIVYEALSLVLSDKHSEENHDEKSQRQASILPLIKRYLVESCEQENGRLVVTRNINQCINLISQVQRAQINIDKQTLPNILNINIQAKGYSMDIVTMENLVRYLVEKKFDKQEQKLKELFKKLQPLASTFFNNKRVNYRTTLNVLQLAGRVNHQNSNIYRKVERSILEILQKYPDFIISSHDLHILKQNLVKRRFATKNMEALVKQGIESPQDWKEIRRRFIQRQNSFAINKQRNKRKNDFQNKQEQS